MEDLLVEFWSAPSNLNQAIADSAYAKLVSTGGLLHVTVIRESIIDWLRDSGVECKNHNHDSYELNGVSYHWTSATPLVEALNHARGKHD